jgi:CBS domain-containing protein
MDMTRHSQPLRTGATPYEAPTDDGGDHFLRLMFFRPLESASRRIEPAIEPVKAVPLPQARLRASASYYLPDANRSMPEVRLASDAVDVMTDLQRVDAATIGRLATVEEANLAMIAQRVRSLFVVDQRRIVGIVTASDILGERPLQVGQQLGIHHNEVMVRDIMTPEDAIEVIDFSRVLEATVGDIVATLKRAHRQHALVSDLQPESLRQRVRGIFSLTQIARQLGISPVSADIDRTFAQVEVLSHAS